MEVSSGFFALFLDAYIRNTTGNPITLFNLFLPFRTVRSHLSGSNILPTFTYGPVYWIVDYKSQAGGAAVIFRWSYSPTSFFQWTFGAPMFALTFEKFYIPIQERTETRLIVGILRKTIMQLQLHQSALFVFHICYDSSYTIFYTHLITQLKNSFRKVYDTLLPSWNDTSVINYFYVNVIAHHSFVIYTVFLIHCQLVFIRLSTNCVWQLVHQQKTSRRTFVFIAKDEAFTVIRLLEFERRKILSRPAASGTWMSEERRGITQIGLLSSLSFSSPLLPFVFSLWLCHFLVIRLGRTIIIIIFATRRPVSSSVDKCLSCRLIAL